MAKNEAFAKILKHSAYIGTLCGLGYFVAVVFIHLIGLSYSEMINWVFRIAIVVACIWAVISFRIANNNKISFGRGFVVGILTTIVLGACMAVAALIFYNVVAPEYHPKAQEIYEEKREEQMYAKELIKKRVRSEEADEDIRAKIRLNAEDTAKIQSGLKKHMEQTAYYFTANAQAIINFIYSLIWGLAIALSVAYMSKRN
jgi:lipopolysaccharide export LptBFGC system permease protein LptF